MRTKLIESLKVLRLLSFRRARNILLLEISYLRALVSKRISYTAKPVSASIEPTTSCNLRCPECPSGLRKFSRNKGNLKLDDFKVYLDALLPELMYLNIYFQGEPLLNPDFTEMVKYAGSKRVYTMTSTNGHYLSGENCTKILNSGLDKLIISLDGLSQESYEKYRKEGNLETVTDGIDRLVQKKKELGSEMLIVIQFLVFDHNKHEIEAIKKWSIDHKVDKLELKTAQFYEFEDGNELMPDIAKFSRYEKGSDGKFRIKSKLPNRCRRMWFGTVITWDGNVVPCCFDKDADHVMGSLKDPNFNWNSKKYSGFRKKVLTGRKEIDICRNCTEGIR